MAAKQTQPERLTLRPLHHPNYDEIAVAQIFDKYSDYPSNGLTPVRLAEIFREADTGDVFRQMELFEEMEEHDPHLFSQLQTRKNAVTGLDFEIIPFDSDNEDDKSIAEFVKNELGALENIEDVMMDLLDAIGKGISVSEILWAYQDGKVIIDDIKHRHQKRFFWDSEDCFRVYTKEHPEGLQMPQNKFIIHRYKARSGHPARAGVLRVVAWMYLFKNYSIKDWVSFCEIYGMPLRLGKYNPAASDADKLSLMNALVQIGTDAAGIIPEGTSIEFKESAKISTVDAYERLARYCDEQMSKAILGQTLTSDSGGGSFAQSKTHNEVRHDLTVADCKALASTLRRDLIKPLVYFNFGEDRRIPYIRFDCEESEDLKELAEILGTLTEHVGLKVPTSYIYKKFSIPKPERGEEVAARQSGGFPFPMKAQLIPNKAVSSSGYSTQARIDAMADAALQRGESCFTNIFAPLADLLLEVDSLDELKAILENDAKVQALLKQMGGDELEELLQKAMLYANLEGRLVDDG